MSLTKRLSTSTRASRSAVIRVSCVTFSSASQPPTSAMITAPRILAISVHIDPAPHPAGDASQGGYPDCKRNYPSGQGAETQKGPEDRSPGPFDAKRPEDQALAFMISSATLRGTGS